MVRLALTAVPLTRRALQRLPANIYPGTGAEFAKADTVKHSAKECARREGDIVVHTNTIESVFLGVPPRQHDVYQHCVKPILTVTSPSLSSATTALAEFGIEDAERGAELLLDARDKRITC